MMFSPTRVLLVTWLCLALAPVPGLAQRAKKPVAKKSTQAALDMSALQTQVMLDRAGFSPGEIDASMGTSTKRALEAFTKNGGDASALPADAVQTYTITDQDAAGPFTTAIPEDMVEKSKLPALGYSSLVEALGERFHASPNLLKRLNPGAKFAAGEEVNVPSVTPTAPAMSAAVPPEPGAPPQGRADAPQGRADAPQGRASAPEGRASAPQGPAGTTVTVRKSTSDLVVADTSGKVLMYAPVTTGSEHDPLPIGEWKVTGVQRDPKFHYNPALFWDAEPGHSKATIPAGPNNPVGVAWIDITREHYGLHGTPEPATVGKTASHGCVRLTNWDVTRLASLVRPGTKVVFAE
jgi:lipoprotein-anchoring transpeptidase ErfK/SrfK